MFPPLLLKPTDTVHSMCACQKSPKRSPKGSDFKEDDRACPSRSYYSRLFVERMSDCWVHVGPPSKREFSQPGADQLSTCPVKK